MCEVLIFNNLEATRNSELHRFFALNTILISITTNCGFYNEDI